MSIETDSPVVYHGTSESRFPKNEIQKMVKELTVEERETFRQCNKESLYYRCLPFAAIGMAATHLAAKKGFIKPHRIFGTTFPMAGAAFLGWIIGKFSYRRQCEDKFVRLENSNIGQAIRKKRGYVSDRLQSDFSKSSTFEEDMNLSDPSFSYYPDSDFHSSANSLNLDMDKNIQYSGLDDRERPSTDRDVMQSNQESGPARTFTTYEDLRYRNREKYARSQPQSPQLGEGTKPWSNVDNVSPRRSSDFNDGENRRTGSNTNTWDTKLF